jgi:thiol-disulfide isomerase/thioredoxin
MRKRHVLFASLMVVGAVASGQMQPARPAFPSIQIYDSKGQPFPIKDSLGAVTVLNFWATWCGPCRIELPELEKLYNELGGKGLVVLAINVDGPPSGDYGVTQQFEVVKPRVDAFLQRVHLAIPVYYVDPATQGQLGIDRLPFTVLLDRGGNVAQVYPGYSPDSMQNLRKLASSLLSEQRQGGK